tara:strand:- start:1100 stop:1318 length:219 start_codon:yes stop_codon:yes gene_type:complete
MAKKYNGKKKTLPVKPTPRRTENKNKKKAKKIVEVLAPAEGKLVNKVVNDKKYRNDLFTGFMKGITFGLYNP